MLVSYHGGQNGQKECCRGDVAGTLSEGGDQEANDDGDGPRGDGVQRGHLSTEPVGQARHLTATAKKITTQIFHRDTI